MGNMMGKDTQNGISLLENDKISTGKKQDKISSHVTAKEVELNQLVVKDIINGSQVQESVPFSHKLTQMLLCVSFFNNKLGNNMLLGQRNRISRLENNKISSKVCINEQEELMSGQEENMKNIVLELQTKVGSLDDERE